MRGLRGLSWYTDKHPHKKVAATLRPNILYLHSHDTGRYIQPYGAPVSSPTLQRFAEAGVMFRDAHAAAPTCSASRAALLTGQMPHNAGMMGLTHRGWLLHDYRQHLVHSLHAVGYTSALVGVQHIAPEPGGGKRIGYHQPLPTKGARAAEILPAALSYLLEPPDKPFFLSVGFAETHLLPKVAPNDSSFGYAHGDSRYVLPPPPLPDEPETRQDMADLEVSLRVLDNAYGAILDALERSGQAENTLVIITTDHGLPLPGMKGQLTVQGTGVCLMLRGPGGFSGGKVIDALVSQLDVYPTLCELLELPLPAWLQGRSLLPLVRGETTRLHNVIFTETTHHVAYEPQRAVRTERYCYIRRYAGRERPVLINCDDSPSKSVWLKAGWQERGVSQTMLFDRMFDPDERQNLSGRPEYADIEADLALRLQQWQEETNDPLLRGPVPVPPGTFERSADAISPGEPHISETPRRSA